MGDIFEIVITKMNKEENGKKVKIEVKDEEGKVEVGMIKGGKYMKTLTKNLTCGD